tara:strand:- start:232 stop:363 length:132 start_codon:yes stop_codon:yes gene_type:complete
MKVLLMLISTVQFFVPSQSWIDLVQSILSIVLLVIDIAQAVFQ